jgi:hypothetical protein
MNKDKQRLAIAQACKWGDWNMRFHETINGKLMAHRSKVSGLVEVPDYLNDLNAMHEAAKTLDVKTAMKYVTVLSDVFLDYQCLDYGPNPYMLYIMVHAPAWVRAEAFLKTLNLWEV